MLDRHIYKADVFCLAPGEKAQPLAWRITQAADRVVREMQSGDSGTEARMCAIYRASLRYGVNVSEIDSALKTREDQSI